jgi:hypothetical protein
LELTGGGYCLSFLLLTEFSEAGLVHNKSVTMRKETQKGKRYCKGHDIILVSSSLFCEFRPFSFELRCTLHPSSAVIDTSASSMPMFTTPIPLLFKLAVKVSARPMEKRTNLYQSIVQAWSRREPTYTPLPTISIESRKDRRKRAKKSIASPRHPNGSSESISSGVSLSTTCPSPLPHAAHLLSTLPDLINRSSTPLSASSATSSTNPSKIKNKNAMRDRTIGTAPIQTTTPSIHHLYSITDVDGNMNTLLSKLWISITAEQQGDKVGLLELVTTKGGGGGTMRPKQR